MDKDRYKSATLKRPKGKAPPPSNLIALGKQARASNSDGDTASSRKFTSSPLSDRKREAAGAIPSSSAIKKPKLLGQTFTPLGRTLDDRRPSPATKLLKFEEVAVEVDNDTFLKEVVSADRSDDDARVEELLCGAVKQLRGSRFKPDSCLYMSLMYLAQSNPQLFMADLVTEAFCYLLKREVAMSFKSKGNPIVSVLSANVLMHSYAEERNWPDQFVKVFAEDSLGDRVWVDRKECRLFVRNICTAFGTKLPPEESLMSAGDSTRPGDQSGSASPVVLSQDDDDNTMDMDTTPATSVPDDILDSDIIPRYGYQKSVVESYMLELLTEQLSRRGNVDVSVRNLIKLMMVTCCYSEVRLMAAQRLEMWLMNNAKLNKCAQDLLMTVCMNCDQNDKKDTEVIIQLLKIRLKTKPLINHFLLSMKELVNQNTSNLQTILTHTIYNELSNSRNPNNMAVLQALFQHASDDASSTLAEIFQDLLSNRDDYLRALRALLREIVRTMRPDVNFLLFCRGLLHNRNEKKYQDMEALFKERYILSLADLVTLCMLLGITTQVREAHSAMTKGEHKDVECLVDYQRQVSEIQRDCIWWLHLSVPIQGSLKAADYLHCLNKLLFMENMEHYHNKDNWPPETERGFMLRIASESPAVEDTLTRIMIIGLDQSLPVSATDALEICDQLVKRTTSLYIEGRQMLKIQRIEIIDALFNLSKYNYPDNILLPKGYKPPDLAISANYWKAWTMLLIITAYNPQVFGNLSWKSFEDWNRYETLKCLIEMVITNNYKFPPPIMSSDDKVLEDIKNKGCNYKFPPPTMSSDEKVLEDIKNKERMVCEEEKHLILEFESHLAAATTKVAITEQNSLLLSTLIGLNPNGIARRPPQQVLDQIKTLGVNLRLRELLCKSRSPDFLLDIIQRQGTSQSMPWLANLVESSEGSFDVLPVQCLCEFLLMEQTEEEEMGDEGVSIRKAEKHEALLRRMQSLVCSLDVDITMAHELLTYFLCRLSSQQASSRTQATKGLSMVLDTSIWDTDSDDSAVFKLFPKQTWLFQCLPSLPLFDQIRDDVCSAVRKALQVESDPSLLGSYIIFLSQHTRHLDLQDLDDVVLDLSQLIVERTTVMNFLMPIEPTKRPPGSNAIISAFVRVYMNYMRKAQRMDDNQAYTWSNIQDQIMLQWKSGASATMRVLVVHAIIILLTYVVDDPEYIELLNTWFPTNQNPPSAYLLDTSEEALLLPDWLKLRMIRSSSDRVVNAALQDIEPGQLLLFVQSFGIPVSSMSHLLRCLDEVTVSDADTLRGSIVDTGYMLQLVEIQKLRGATGGDAFACFLNEKTPAPPPKDESMETAAMKPISHIWTDSVKTEPVTPHQSVDTVAVYLLQLFTSTEQSSYKDMYKNLQDASGLTNCKRLQAVVIEAINSILKTKQKQVFVRGLETKSGLSTLLFRIFCVNKQAKENPEVATMLGTIRDSCTEKRSCFYNIVASGSKVKVEQDVKVGETGKEKSLDKVTAELMTRVQNNDTSLEKRLDRFMTIPIKNKDVKELTNMVQTNDSSLEKRLDRFMTRQIKNKDVKGAAQVACQVLNTTSSQLQFMTRLIKNKDVKGAAQVACQVLNATSSQNNMSSHLFTDWLELLDPEVVTCVPESQRHILFGKIDAQLSDQGAANNRRAYLLSLLTHHSSWSTLHKCLNVLLADHTKYNATTVLDFLWACYHIPKIWQGRDKAQPMNYTPEDVFNFTTNQLETVVEYLIAEATDKTLDPPISPTKRSSFLSSPMVTSPSPTKSATKKSSTSPTKSGITPPMKIEIMSPDAKASPDLLSPKKSALKSETLASDDKSTQKADFGKSITDRIETIKLCVSDDDKKLKAIVDYIQQRIQQKDSSQTYCLQLITELYIQWPYILCWITDTAIVSSSEMSSHCSISQIDVISHRLITSLTHAIPSKLGEARMCDANIACRKLASQHPSLFLRQLPMLAALLKGRTGYSLAEMRHRKFLQLFTHVLGLFELLEPHVFTTQTPGFEDSLEVYFDLFRVHGLEQRNLSLMIVKFVTLLHRFLDHCPHRAAVILKKYVPILSDISVMYPDLSTLRSLLAALTLPHPTDDTTPEEDEPSPNPATARPSSPWTETQLAPFHKKLQHGNSYQDIHETLHDLDETSKRKVSILSHFMDDLARLMTVTNERCRTLSHTLVMRYVRHSPDISSSILPTFLHCLDSGDSAILTSALSNLAEFAGLCQDHASVLLQRAFAAGIKQSADTLPSIIDAFSMLNTFST